MSRYNHHTIAYYSAIGVMNLAVATMFYVTAIPSPAVAALSSVYQPMRIKIVAATQGTPINLAITSLNIKLPVKVGSYNAADGSWSIDLSGAYFADTSMPINNSNGTTLIYGHAQSPVFASLPQIQSGATAVITTDTHHVFVYEYQSMQQVLPNDTSVFAANGPPTLILQTCIGDYSEYRALFSFKLVSVDGHA